MVISEYNFKYVSDIYNSDEDTYEKTKITNVIDKAVSHYDQSNARKLLFHMVPIIYTFAIILGLSVYVYTLANNWMT